MPFPRNPPKLEVFTPAAINAMAGSSFDSSTGGFVPSGSSDVNFLILEDKFDVTYGTATEAGANLTLPMDNNAHALVSTATYQGGGIWRDGGGVDWSLEVVGPGSAASVRAVQA